MLMMVGRGVFVVVILMGCCFVMLLWYVGGLMGCLLVIWMFWLLGCVGVMFIECWMVV